MEGFNLNNAPKFQTPQEELEFLRAHIAEREQALTGKGEVYSKESLAHGVIEEYKKVSTARSDASKHRSQTTRV